MRNLTVAMREMLNAQETGQALFSLLTMSHPSITTQRFVNNQTVVVSRGESFTPYPFDLTIPDDRDDEVVRLRLVIDNIDRSIVAAIRSIQTPPTFTLEIVRSGDPDTVAAGPFACTLRNVNFDALTVSGDLTYENMYDEPVQQFHYTPDLFPGLHNN